MQKYCSFKNINIKNKQKTRQKAPANQNQSEVWEIWKSTEIQS